MKKFYLGLAVLTLSAVWLIVRFPASGQEKANVTSDPNVVSSSLVISQLQAGGGVAEDEFIEIHNVGTTPVDLNGYRVVYRSFQGTTDVGPMAAWSSSTVLQPGQFYLIAALSYDGNVPPDIT